MGFEISKIQNAELKKIAEKVDKKNVTNGYIDDSEFSVFSKKAEKTVKKDEAAKTEFNSIAATFGEALQLSTKSAVTNPVTADKEKKEIEKEITKKVKELEKAGKDKEGLIEGLEKAFAEVYHAHEADGQEHLIGDLKRDANGKIIVQPQYKAYIDEIARFYDAVEAAGDNKDAKKALKTDKFHEGLISSLEKVAQHKKDDAAAVRLEQQYNQKLGTGVDFKAAYKAVKKENKSENKEALRQLKEYAKGKAYDEASDILKDENTRPDGESKMAIRKQMRALNHDAYYRKAVQDLKTDREVIGNQNRVKHFVEEHPALSADEMKSGLKRRAAFGAIKTHGGADLREKMESFKNPDGTYNSEAIADLVLNRAGFDAEISRNDDDKIMAEIEHVRLDLEAASGQKVEFSENEAKRVAKLVKVKIEHKDYAGAFVRNLIPFAGAVAAGGASGFVAKNGKISITNDLTQTVKIKTSDLESIKKQLTEAGVNFDIETLETNSGTVTVKQHIFQQIVRNDRQLNAIMGSYIGAGIGGAAMLLTILMDAGKNEKSCISVSDFDRNDPKYTDKDRYKAYIDQRYGNNPLKAAALKALVDNCVKEEENSGVKWYDNFQNLIRQIGGFGSKVNPKECIGVKYLTPKTPAVQVTPPPAEQTEAYIADETETKTETKEVEKFWGARKHQNKDLVKMYPCLVEDFGETKAIAMMKVIQGIKNGFYDVDYISSIADDHFKMLNGKMTRAQFIAKYKDAPNFDVNTYLSVRGAKLIGDEKEVEKEVNGRKVKTIDTFILAPAELTRNGQVYCRKDESLVTRTIDRNAKGGGSKYGTLNGSYSTQSQSQTYWGGKKGDQSATQFGSKEQRNNWQSGLPAGTKVIPVKDKNEINNRIKVKK